MEYRLRDKKILFYSAGSVAGLISEMLIQKGFHVEGFIDRRGDVIREFREKKVFTIEQASRIPNQEDYCVIICIRNVFEHSYIAQELIESGFHNILFKPLSVLKGEGTSHELLIKRLHDTLLEKKEIPNLLIPDVYNAIELRDGCFICEKDGLVKAGIPSELLFTGLLKNNRNSRWSQVSFLCEYVAVELYEAFSGDDEFLNKKIDKYIDEFALPGAISAGVNTDGDWKALIVSNRKAVYEEMQDMSVTNPCFFIDNCPLVSVFGNGFYLISSGKNRVSFQIAKGKRLIPVAIKKDEYEFYINAEELKETLDIIREEGFPKLRAPIAHPFFVDYPVYSKSYALLWLKKIGRILSNAAYEKSDQFCYKGINGWLSVDDYGISERFLASLGMEICDIFPKNAMHKSLDKLLRFESSKKSDVRDYYFGVFDYLRYELDAATCMMYIKHTQKYIFTIFPMNSEYERKVVADLKNFGFGKGAFLFSDVYDNTIVKGMAFEKGD